MHHCKAPQTDLALKPSGVLAAAQATATRLRKMLRSKMRRPGLESGTMADAARLAELIEQLARFGKLQPAEDAIDVVGLVEILLEQLRSEIDAIIVA